MSTKIDPRTATMSRKLGNIFLISFLGIFALAASLALLAKERPSLRSSLNSTQVTDCLASGISPEEAKALLPVIPPPSSSLNTSLPSGVAPGIIGPLPGELPPDPNSSKTLYGYIGPYYNTNNLDGQVTVITESLYTWPVSSWTVTGMLRNQTRCSIKLTSLSAQLFGRHGELLAEASTSVPIIELRPGEPGPFSINAPIPAADVVSVKWEAAYVRSQGKPRLFDLTVFREEEGEERYFLDGTIRNASTATARDVHVVMAWLDSQGNGRVHYVATGKLRRMSNPKVDLDRFDLDGGATEEFLFETEGQDRVPFLGNMRLALWGVSQ